MYPIGSNIKHAKKGLMNESCCELIYTTVKILEINFRVWGSNRIKSRLLKPINLIMPLINLITNEKFVGKLRKQNQKKI